MVSASARGDFTELVVDRKHLLQSAAESDRPGQYYFVQAGAVATGGWHPFSVAYGDSDRISFYVQAQGKGSWTRRLLIAAEGGAMVASLDGPYGGLSLRLEDYDSLYLIAGGSGITPLLNTLRLVLGSERYRAVRFVALHWAVRGPALVNLLRDKLEAALDLREAPSQEKLFMPEVLVNIWDTSSAGTGFHTEGGAKGILISRGRVDISAVVGGIAPSMVGGTLQACVLVCGPAAMTQQTLAATTAAGIDCHIESFLL